MKLLRFIVVLAVIGYAGWLAWPFISPFLEGAGPDVAASRMGAEAESGGEETPAVLVQCRTSDEAERLALRETIRDRVRAITGMNCLIELIPPRTLPRTSSGKLSRAKAKKLYLAGEIVPIDLAA